MIFQFSTPFMTKSTSTASIGGSVINAETSSNALWHGFVHSFLHLAVVVLIFLRLFLRTALLVLRIGGGRNISLNAAGNTSRFRSRPRTQRKRREKALSRLLPSRIHPSSPLTDFSARSRRRLSTMITTMRRALLQLSEGKQSKAHSQNEKTEEYPPPLLSNRSILDQAATLDL